MRRIRRKSDLHEILASCKVDATNVKPHANNNRRAQALSLICLQEIPVHLRQLALEVSVNLGLIPLLELPAFTKMEQVVPQATTRHWSK